MKWPLCQTALLVGCVLLAAVPGCGGDSSPIKITGKIIRNGQPIQVAKGTYVTVIFTPEEKTGSTFPAKFKYDTGTYEVILPPGKYRVMKCVVQEKDQDPVSSSQKTYNTVHDLTSPKEVDIPVVQ